MKRNCEISNEGPVYLRILKKDDKTLLESSIKDIFSSTKNMNGNVFL